MRAADAAAAARTGILTRLRWAEDAEVLAADAARRLAGAEVAPADAAGH